MSLLRRDISCDLVVLRLRNGVFLHQVIGVVVGTVVDDALRGGVVDAGELLQFAGRRLVDVHGALVFEAIDYTLGDGFGVLGHFFRGPGRVLLDGVGTAPFGSAGG